LIRKSGYFLKMSFHKKSPTYITIIEAMRVKTRKTVQWNTH